MNMELRKKYLQYFLIVELVQFITSSKSDLIKNSPLTRSLEDDFDILNNHFEYTTDIELRWLSYKGDHFAVDLLDTLLNYKWFKKAILVTKVGLEENIPTKNYSHSQKQVKFHRSHRNCPNKREFRISFEKVKGVIITADSVDRFEQYFSSQVNLTKESRCLYVLILPYKPYRASIDMFLRRRWIDMRMLNVIIFIPCTNLSKGFVYIFRPFKYHDGDYGTVEPLSKAQVKNCPQFLLNNAKNMYGWPMNISIFPRKTSALCCLPRLLTGYRIYNKIPQTTQLYGSDGVLTSEISLALNFSVSKIVNSSGFGKVYGNLTATGTTGQVLRKEVDLQGNPRFMAWHHVLGHIEYTSHFTQDELCIIIPKSSLIPKWLKPYLNIPISVWILILGYMLISTCINNLLQFSESRCLVTSGLEIWGMTISQCCSRINRRGKRMRRIFLSCILFCSINLTSMFSATMYEALTTKTFYGEISSLEELDSSNIIIKSSIRAFEGSPTRLYQNLDNKTFTTYQGFGLDLVAYSGKRYAALERYYDAHILLKTKYITDDGVPLLHMIPDCPVQYFLSLILPRGSPFLPEINLVIGRLREGGFGLKWFKDFADALIYEKILSLHSRDVRLVALNTENLQVAFYILFLGYGVSILIFCSEVLYSFFKCLYW